MQFLGLNQLKGSSLTISAHGWWGKEKKNAAAKNPVRPRKNTAEGGGGGDSAVFLQKIEAKPAALLVQSRTQQKSFLFLLEEKIWRAQIRKSRENFFAGWRVVASGGWLAHFRFLFLDLCIRFGKMISKVCEGFNSGAMIEIEQEIARFLFYSLGFFAVRTFAI